MLGFRHYSWIAFVGMIATPVAAATKLEIAQGCVEAVQAGDVEGASQLANEIKGWKNLFGPPTISAATTCLIEVTGEHWAYFTTQGGFLSGDDARAEQAFIDGADARAAERQREIIEKMEERARLVCELDRAFRDLQRVEERRAQASEKRSAETKAKTYSVCSILYDRDPEAAILSPVCNASFLNNGLPETQVRVDFNEWVVAAGAFHAAAAAMAEFNGDQDDADEIEPEC